jgi:PEGA domain
MTRPSRGSGPGGRTGLRCRHRTDSLERVPTEEASPNHRRRMRVGVAVAVAIVIVPVIGVILGLEACGRRSADEPPPPDAPAARTVPFPAVVPMPVFAPVVPQATASRPHLHLTLRSTPSGAAVTVDGRLAGPTPTRWDVEDDARQHDFAFILRGYAPWRLRFSPSRDGVVHATLEAIRGPDAGVP